MSIKLQVKGKVKESTDLENVVLNEKEVKGSGQPIPGDQPSMTPEQMAAILDKAMQILDKNWLTDQMKGDQSPEDWAPPPPAPCWWDQDQQPKDPRKVYTFSLAWWWITQPLVADNIKQALDNAWSGNVMVVYVEDYTPPVPSQWLSHEWFETPFYY